MDGRRLVSLAEDCILLSALAEGADTLAAQVALQMGWQVIAPLPLEPDEYRRDFKDQEASNEFDKLLKDERISHFFIGYAPGNERLTDPRKLQDEDVRNRQYAYLGEFLTRHCEVLIALWDGKESQGFGGTGDVVRMQREGIPADIIEMRRDGALLDNPEGGRMIQIWTQRIKKGEAQPAELSNGKTHGSVESDTSQDAKTSGQTVEQRKERRKNWQRFVEKASDEVPIAQGDLPPLDLASSDLYLRSVRDAYLRADALAGRFQKEVDVRFKLILGAGIAFTFCVAGADAFLDETWSVWILVSSWLFLLLAIGIVQLEKRVNAPMVVKIIALWPKHGACAFSGAPLE